MAIELSQSCSKEEHLAHDLQGAEYMSGDGKW